MSSGSTPNTPFKRAPSMPRVPATRADQSMHDRSGDPLARCRAIMSRPVTHLRRGRCWTAPGSSATAGVAGSDALVPTPVPCLPSPNPPPRSSASDRTAPQPRATPNRGNLARIRNDGTEVWRVTPATHSQDFVDGRTFGGRRVRRATRPSRLPARPQRRSERPNQLAARFTFWPGSQFESPGRSLRLAYAASFQEV
jgi:hypothetical protein